MIDELLVELQAPELVTNIRTWNDPGPSPYSLAELAEFGTLTEDRCLQLNEEHVEFKRKHSSLSVEQKRVLREHVYENFWKIECSRHKRFQRIDETVRIVRSHFEFDEDKRILDVGSSHGLHGLLHLVFRHDLKGTFCASDLLPINIKLLSLLGIDTYFCCAKYEKFTECEGTFDYVMCNEVLEHLDQTSEDNLLHRFKTVTKPDGLMLITFPTNANPNPTDLAIDPLGHVRQPDLDYIIPKLGEQVHRGKFSTGKQSIEVAVVKNT